MPAAARISDQHRCPKHKGGPIDSGCPTVIIGYERAARVGDTLVCRPGHDAIKRGEPTVLIGNQQAARIGDATDHDGEITAGCPTVIIGPTATSLRTDKPVCEDCEAKRKAEIAQAERKAGR